MYRDIDKQGVPAKPSPGTGTCTADASPSSDASRRQELLPLEQEQADQIEVIINAYDASLETSLKGTVMDPESKTQLGASPASASTQSQQSSGADETCAVPQQQLAGARASTRAGAGTGAGAGADGADSSAQGAAGRTANEPVSPDATPTQAMGVGNGVEDVSSPSTPASSASGGSGSTGSLLAALFRASIPPNMSGSSLDSMVRTVTDMINLCEISMRRIIAFAKRVPSFKRLPQTDQMTLLKGGAVELLILRGALSYDLAQGVFHGALAMPYQPEPIHIASWTK